MIFGLLFFIIDYLTFCFFERQLFFFLIIYFIIQNLNIKTPKKALFFSLILLLIQDVFINSRFGIGLAYILPIIILAELLKKIMNQEAIKISYFIFFIIFIVLDNFFIKHFILGLNFNLNSTLLKFSINLLLEILILLGMLGNRTLFIGFNK